MIRLRSFALVAAALFAAPAQSAPLPLVPLPELLAAAKAICFDHAGDTAAQIAMARAKPFNARLARIADDGTLLWDAGHLAIAISEGSAENLCLVTAAVDPKIRIGDGIKLSRPMLGEPDSADEVFVLWNGKSPSGKPAMYSFMLKGEGGNTLGSYASASE